MSESEYSGGEYNSSEDIESRQRSRDRLKRQERDSSNFGAMDCTVDNSRSVNVCNVPYACKTPDLKDLFKRKVGKVTHVEQVKEGSFVVEFSDSKAVDDAMKTMHRYEIDGRAIIVKKQSDGGRSRGGGGGGSSSGRGSGGMGHISRGGAGGNRTVYVCNIPYDCKSGPLKTLFNKEVGGVSNVSFIRQGSAYIEFRKSDNADKAIEVMNRFEMDGRRLVVKAEAPPGVKPPMDLRQNIMPGMAGSMGRNDDLMGGFSRFNDPSMMSRGFNLGGAGGMMNNLMDQTPGLLGPIPGDRNPFSRISSSQGFGRSMKNDYDEPSPLSSNFPSALNNSRGNSLSSAFDQSSNAGLLSNSLSMGRTNQSYMPEAFQDNSLRLAQSAPSTSNSYGLSSEFLESKGIHGPLVRKVFIANIDYKVTTDDIKELFSLAGTVTDAELKKDNDGRSKGYGFVEFEHPVEAVQAISMLHDQLYYDRKISVQMARASQLDEIKGRKDGRKAKLPKGLQSLGIGLGVGGTAMKNITKILDKNE